ncbi:helicase-associated domain-containing protein [Intrasporangium sp. DVR]|uniref:helicase-associated domain-containing protein n=1 Tax=Intrasporangium sp. DVR TaxID=3127867 RepID=UPI00313A4F79
MAINSRDLRAGRSLADDIRARDDRELVALVLARPDLARPVPADLTSLAARASTKASVQRAIDALDEGHLRVLEALVVAAEPAVLGDLLRLLGVDESEEPTVQALVDDLWVRALLWRGSDGTHVVRTVPEVLGPSVAGLGAAYRDLRPGSPVPTEAQVRTAVDAAPDAARTVLDRLTWGPAAGVLPTGPAGSTAVRWLLERRLLVSVGGDRVALPREIGLVLRGGRLHRATRLRAPDLTARDVAARVVDAVAGGAASDLLSRVDELSAAWGAEPPRVLRAGGLSVRDLRSAQQVLDVEPERAAFVIEVSYAAGLVGDDGEIVPVWAPTPELDEWSASEAGRRWAVLARAWLSSTRAPHLVGRRIGDSSANALGPDVQWPAIRGLRQEVLAELAFLEPGMAADGDAIRERLHWRRPLRSPALLDDAIEGVLREAEWLGVTGRGAISSPGRALLGLGTAGPLDEVAAAMSPHLPAPVDHILVQADLTAVAPGPLEGSLAAFMRLASDLESRGGATVHRFTPDSVRRALDAGWTAADVLDTIRRSSRTPVPQPLEYLVTDVARKHGVTRVGSSAAYVRSDDEAVLDAMLATRDLAALRLRRLAPTVLVSDADPAVLVEMLRDGGFAPVVEGRDGGVVVAGPEQRRARPRRRPAAPTTTPVDETFTTALVAGLRAAEASADERRADEAARPGPSIPSSDPVVTLALLREAMADGHGVWIGVTDRLGATTRHLIHPRRVEGGRVFATDEAGHEKTWSVHRITGATLDTP